MRNTWKVLSVGVAVVAAGVASVRAQEQKTGSGAPPAGSEQAMMEAYMKAIAPNEHHAALAQLAGDWKCDIRYMMAPGAPAQESKGTAHLEMLMGGRYLQEKVKSEMMGQAFEGMGLTGYDNAQHKYVSSWIDTMSTGIMSGEGQWDEATKAFTSVQTAIDPMTGKSMSMRMVTRVESPTRHVSEFFQAGPDGKEFKSMEIVYTKL